MLLAVPPGTPQEQIDALAKQNLWAVTWDGDTSHTEQAVDTEDSENAAKNSPISDLVDSPTTLGKALRALS